MMISGFNPNVSIFTFQATIQSDAPQNVVKDVAFIALANHTPEQLSEGLDKKFITTIQGFVDAREEQIKACLKKIDDLVDFKLHLIKTHPDVKKKKELTKKLKENTS